MGKLNIAHHKSYHPYRRDNIERVRKDEEEARLKEEREEGRMMLADAEARIDLLRQKAGTSEQSEKKKRRHKGDDDMKSISSSSSMQTATLPTTDGHINLFEDLEQTQKAIASAIKASTKKTSVETDKGVSLAPAPKDLKPWYVENRRNLLKVGEDEEGEGEGEEGERRRREENRKLAQDPLTSITKQLAAKTSTSAVSRTSMRPPAQSGDRPPEVQARLFRESSERMRAMELIRRKKREMEGSSTPSTMFGDSAGGYGDVYNRREVEEAHKHRDRWREGGYGHRRWDDEDKARDRRPRQW